MTVDVSKIIAWYDVRKGETLNLTNEQAFKMAAKYGELTEPKSDFSIAEDVTDWLEDNGFLHMDDAPKFGDILIVEEGMFIGIFSSQFQIMQKRIPLRNLFIILAVVAVSFFLLLTVVSQSLAVLFATLLGCTMGVVLDGQ